MPPMVEQATDFEWRADGEAAEVGLLEGEDLEPFGPAPGAAAVGEVVVAWWPGRVRCVGVPPFAAPEGDGRRPWEEAGLLERRAELHPPEGKS